MGLLAGFPCWRLHVLHGGTNLLVRNNRTTAKCPPPTAAPAHARPVPCTGSVPRMLDAVGGHVAKRIRARHIHAVTRPADITALLQAYSDTRHNSVMVPELLAACALQVRTRLSIVYLMFLSLMS